jgi:hypothetical protein
MFQHKKIAKISFNKKNKETEDIKVNDNFISDISDISDEEDYKKIQFSENVLNNQNNTKIYYSNPLLEPNKKITSITNPFSLNYKPKQQQIYTSSLFIQPPPPSPPILKKDEYNENLLEDLKLLDTKLDDILNIIINKNISTEIIDPNIKTYIELLKDKIDSKAGIIHDELSYSFGKKPLYRNFFIDSSFIYDPNLNSDNEIKDDYDYNKKIFI